MPNRVLVSLLRFLSSRDAANAAVGDALEELGERSAAHSRPLFPALWIDLQIVRAIATASIAGVPRLRRSLGVMVRDAVRALRAARAHSLFVGSV